MEIQTNVTQYNTFKEKNKTMEVYEKFKIVVYFLTRMEMSFLKITMGLQGVITKFMVFLITKIETPQ